MDALPGGTVESSGRFTLDPAAAGRQASQSLLANPRFYVLKLLQWAVARGASRISCEISRRRVVFEHDGGPTEVARALPNPLMLPEGAVRHLVTGLHAALTLKPEYWVLKTPQRLVLQGIAAGRGFPPPLTLFGPPPTGGPRLTDYLLSLFEFELLRQRAACPEIALRINGRVPEMAPLVLGNVGYRTWVRDGVALEAAAVSRKQAGYLDTGGLTLDPSGLQLVKDAAYEVRLQALISSSDNSNTAAG